MRIDMLALAAVIAAVDGYFCATPVLAGQWGCEILLCASSSNPTWRSVPACHPPMHRLISAMDDDGFEWPTCPEAGTGRPSYEKYADCPDGWSVGFSGNDRGGRGEPNRCTQIQSSCEDRPGGRRDDCRQTVSMARPLRDKPYYFDIAHEDGQVTRHWFDLKR